MQKIKLPPNLKINKITYQNNNLIISSQGQKYLLIKKDLSLAKKMEYLHNLDCNYFLPIYKSLENYEMFLYYDDIDNDKIKSQELVLILADIHTKTLESHDYDEEEKEKYYQEKAKTIDEVMNYYLSLQDHIEEMFYLSKDYYEMIINISKIYRILSLSRKYLDEWYLDDNKKYREAFLINKVSSNNFIFNNKGYFIDLKDAQKNHLITDIINWYKAEYYNSEISNLFDLYNSKVNLLIPEIKLFFSSICLVEKIEFMDSINFNLLKIKELFTYIDKTTNFVLEKDKEYQKANQEIFEKENKNMDFSSNEYQE